MSIITDFFNKIDATGGTFVVSSYDALATAIQVPLSSAMVLYFCYLGYMLATGYLQLTTFEIVTRMVRLFLIYALLVGWGQFTAIIYSLFNKLPSNIAAVLNGTNGLGSGDDSYVGTQLSIAYDTITDLADSIIEKSPGWSSMILYSFMAVIVLLFGMFFIGISTAVVIAAKMTLWIVFALGPIFILMAMFDQTRQYFSGWINYLVQIAATITISYVFLSFYLFVLKDSMAQLSVVASSAETVLSHISGIILLMIVGSYVIMQVPAIAAALIGGMAMGISGRSAQGIPGKAGRFAGRLGWKATKLGGRGAAYVASKGSKAATKAAMQAAAKKNLS